MVVDLKVQIGIVDDDDPGACQNLIWRKFFFSSWRTYLFFAKDMAKDVLSAAAATAAATTTAAATAAATTTATTTTTIHYYYLEPLKKT